MDASAPLETAKPVALKRVFVSPGHNDPSEPINGLARELRSLGVKVYPADLSMTDDPYQWLNYALRSQILVFNRYDNGDGRYLQRQLYRAKLLGCSAVRWWVGTDVLNCLESQHTMQVAREVDAAVDLNIAVSPHLVTELRDIGIEAEYVPSFCDFSALPDNAPSPLPKGVLTYLPTHRRAFYGEAVLIAAIEANPDLEFLVIADESHALAHYPNVTSLGWIDDLRDIWSRVGLLLRVTEHDGMPRMVLEALARSRYVIYSEVFEGCWFAKSTEQVLEHLDNFKALGDPNLHGPSIVKFSKSAKFQYLEKLENQLRPGFSLIRFWQQLQAYKKLG
ncbi:hypothetical protein GCM10022278_33850 [Allohahella marinimesophila]|uniref:Uncharacterized protein n=2 Tax=Allohahella marinimesophila TaxID=1054972 RepID=A0ABP7PZF0_9GAMM